MAQTEFLTYKGNPLVRKGNEIYYGDMAKAFVARFEILSTKDEGKLKVPDKVKVQLLKSDPELPDKERIVKESVKDSLFDALDVGFVWLERALG